MKEHQQRVVEEKAALDKKAKDLSYFIGEGALFEHIDLDEQMRLKMQNDFMWQYSEILGQRIANFK
jgi:hypothetical protein